MSFIKSRLPSLFVVLLLFIASSIGAAELCKLLHHQSGQTMAAAQIGLEWGKLVLYFSEKPIINTLSDEPVAGTVYKRVIFFFPQATVISKECHAMMSALNKHKSSLYMFYVTPVEKPIPGVKLEIVYDPKKVTFTHQADLDGMEYAEFDSATSHKGVMFTFYNKEYLEMMEQKTTPILRTAEYHNNKHATA